MVGCTIRDHGVGGDVIKKRSGCGVYVHADAYGRTVVGADCVFARNAGGDVVGPTR